MAPMDTQLKVPIRELPRYASVRSASVGRFHSNPDGGPWWTLVDDGWTPFRM